MMIFITEIPAVLSDKTVKIFEGPLVYAKILKKQNLKLEK